MFNQIYCSNFLFTNEYENLINCFVSRFDQCTVHYLSFANFTLLITFFHLCLKGIQLQYLSLLQFQFWSFMLYNSNLDPLCCEISILVLFMWQCMIVHRHKAPASTASYNNNVLGKSKFDLITILFDILNFLPSEL